MFNINAFPRKAATDTSADTRPHLRGLEATRQHLLAKIDGLRAATTLAEVKTDSERYRDLLTALREKASPYEEIWPQHG